MTVDHKLKKLRNPIFAQSFSDLMMGAMGIIIVLLIFLKIVDVKGQGTVTAVSEIALPPGLRDLNAHPLVRLRLSVCSSAAVLMPVEVSVSASQSPLISEGRVGDCLVKNYVFPDGLMGTPLQIKALANSPQPIYIKFNIGGFHREGKIKPFKADGRVLADINPENITVVKVR